MEKKKSHLIFTAHHTHIKANQSQYTTHIFKSFCSHRCMQNFGYNYLRICPLPFVVWRMVLISFSFCLHSIKFKVSRFLNFIANMTTTVFLPWHHYCVYFAYWILWGIKTIWLKKRETNKTAQEKKKMVHSVS